MVKKYVDQFFNFWLIWYGGKKMCTYIANVMHNKENREPLKSMTLKSDFHFLSRFMRVFLSHSSISIKIRNPNEITKMIVKSEMIEEYAKNLRKKTIKNRIKTADCVQLQESIDYSKKYETQRNCKAVKKKKQSP